MVEDADELPAGIRDYVDRLVGPYFEAVAEWYEALRIGQAGGALQEIIDRRLGDPFFGIFLNPGHQLHLDEWVNSPVWRDSTSSSARAWRSRSTSSRPPAPTVLHDQHRGRHRARRRLAARGVRGALPGRLGAHRARRAFMRDALGITLHPDVLPFSNIPAYLPLAREKKQEVIGSYAVTDGDTGSPEVQIALLTERIRDLTGTSPLPEGQPFASRPPQLVGQRRRLLA